MLVLMKAFHIFVVGAGQAQTCFIRQKLVIVTTTTHVCISIQGV